ncbi:MAG: PCI domain-containing protein [Candidatus Jordarchaeum sp.]|uniref:PCI domain-containing protein n=1 Tax=Candidatus Jordarchaeum sp. TaxID=2823881 RepID=UPI00404A8E8F
MSFIEEPHFTQSRQRFRFLSLNSDKLIQLVSDVVNNYQDGGFKRQELFRDIRDRHSIDVSSLDKEFLEELENGAGIIYMHGKYNFNMNRLLMLMNMFVKEIERVDKDRAIELRQKINQINMRINTLTGEIGVEAAKPMLPAFEEIEEEEQTVGSTETVSLFELEPVDKALTTYIKEYDKLSFIQIASVLGISEDEVKQRLNRMLDQGLIIGNIQDDYFIREAVSTIITPTEMVEIEETSKIVEPIAIETTPAEETVTADYAAETEEVVEEPIIEKPTVKIVERPVIEKPAVKVVKETAVVEKPVIEEPVVEKPVIEEPVVEKPVIEEPVVEKPTVKVVEKVPPEIVYTKKEVKDIYKRMKLFIELVSQVLEMVVAPEKRGFSVRDLSKLVYDYYFLPIDGSFDVEPFVELSKEGVVKVEDAWVRIDLEKSLNLFKNQYIPGIRKVKKRTASSLEKALKQHIEDLVEDIISQARS